MHRSGTSLVAQLLQQLGVYLGLEQELLAPQPDNPGGFWENVRFLEINTRILNGLGGAHDCPPPMPEGWVDDSRLVPVRRAAEQVLREFAAQPVWGWKDPRNSLTLPFWLDLLPDARVVLCIRNPLEVCQSLARRNAFSQVLGLRLWSVYNRRVLKVVPRDRRVITHYDALLRDGHRELARLAGALGVSVSQAQIEQARAVADGELRHSRFKLRHLTAAGLSVYDLALYSGLCDEAGWSDRGEAAGPSNQPRHAMGGSRTPPAVEGWRPGVNVLTGGPAAEGSSTEFLRDNVTTLEALVEERTAWALSLDQELAISREVIRQLHADLESRTRWAQSLDAEIAQRGQTILQLQHDLEERTAWALSLDKQLHELRAMIGRQQAELAQMTPGPTAISALDGR